MKLTKKTKVFVTGAGGMLGEAVYYELRNKVDLKITSRTVNAKFLSELDVTHYDTVDKAIKKFKPDLIIHLAALTDLEYCENNASETWEINAMATEHIAYLCKKLKIPMVYISTAGIYDGAQKFYTDYDFPNPLGIYAKSKYAGELAVQRIVRDHFIFRAGWMMGGGPEKDKKFVNKLMKQIAAGKKLLHVVDDKLGTPTYTFDFAKNMVEVIKSGRHGLFNMVCEGSCSRYDVALEIISLIKKRNIKVKKVRSTYFKKAYFAPRPDSEQLISFKLKKYGLFTMRDWKVCLAEYIVRWK